MTFLLISSNITNMNEEKLNELNRLYNLAEASKVTTNFYNRVYDYIDFIKNNKYLSDILEKDDEEYYEYDKEKMKTLPKRLPNESRREFESKESRHINDGDSSFLTKYFFELDWWIYDPIHIHNTEDPNKYLFDERSQKEIRCILHGEKNENKERYIKNFPNWKNLLERFHNMLLIKIKETPVKESIFRLSKNGSFKYLNKAGAFSVSSREYKILNLLYVNKNEVVSYKEIIEKAFEKEDGTARRIALNTHIKNIKEKLNILPKKKTSQKDIIKNHRGAGYSLEIKDNMPHSE